MAVDVSLALFCCCFSRTRKVTYLIDRRASQVYIPGEKEARSKQSTSFVACRARPRPPSYSLVSTHTTPLLPSTHDPLFSSLSRMTRFLSIILNPTSGARTSTTCKYGFHLHLSPSPSSTSTSTKLKLTFSLPRSLTSLPSLRLWLGFNQS